MQIITAGRTGPNRSVRFGGDPVLDERGRRIWDELLTTALGVLGRGFDS